MTFTLPDLPYAQDALAPHISAETMEYHHSKHHHAYVSKLNSLIPGTDYEGRSLESIIRTASGSIFNNAAQIWNHSFFWHCLSPNGGGEPAGPLALAIENTFGSFANFKNQFNQMAVNNFGAGWTWLVKKTDGSLEILNTSNAGTPITEEHFIPILTVDLWEHAYYIDYRNARPAYLEGFWQLVNWEFAATNFEQ